METRGTREFTESVQEFQQQFQCYKDRSNRRLQDLEDLIEVAAMNIEILKKKKLQNHRKTKFGLYMKQLRVEPTLLERNSVESFIGGLQGRIKDTSKLLGPTTLGKTYKQAKQGIQPEEAVKRMSQKSSHVGFIIEGTCKAERLSNIPVALEREVTAETSSRLYPSLRQLEERLNSSTQFVIQEDHSSSPEETVKNHEQVTRIFSDSPVLDQIVHSVPHVELRPYKSEGARVFDSLQECENPLYAEPIYDEVPGEDKEDWHSEDIICIALGLEDFFQPKQNLEEGNSSGSKVLECTSEFRLTPREVKSDDKDEPTKSRPEFQMPKELIASIKLDELRLLTVPCCISICQGVNSSKDNDKESKDIKLWSFGHVPGHCDKPNIVGSYEVEEKQSANEEEFSIIPTSRRKNFEKSPTAKSSYGLGKMSSNYSKTDVLVFDPGGCVENDHSTSSIDMFKEMIKNKGKLDEVAVINSFGGDQIDQAVSEITEQHIDSMRAGMMARPYRCIVLRQDSLGKVMGTLRFEVKEAWRRKQIITIFDPGGKLGNARSTMRTWLLFKEGDMSGT